MLVPPSPLLPPFMAVSRIYTSPSVRITPVPTSLLRFPPAALPSTLSPPSGELTLAHPFAIPPHIYNALLSVEMPVTVALVYMSTVIIFSYYNSNRDHKPWAINNTRAFRAFVITHNVILALFSVLTFIGMANAVRVSLDGAIAEHSLVGTVDALCKINGPRGLGDAATFNSSTGAWGFTNRALKLAADQLPDTTDIGRIWNEGLAFYGWLFYLSKFYEIFDTLIILAEGKKGSFLQTYYHVGAMISMWAGIRYMAPPTWLFVLVNSFIHVLMVSQAPPLRYGSAHKLTVLILHCNSPRRQSAKRCQAADHHNAGSSIHGGHNLCPCTPVHSVHDPCVRALYLFACRPHICSVI